MFFFMFCFLPHLAALAIIYLKANAGALQSFNLQFLQAFPIDGNFFLGLFTFETYLSFFLVTFIGPGLIAPDLANNALPLYLSRPFSRPEYVIGKLSVLMILTSLVTWIPGLLLVAIQADQAGLSWVWDNIRIPIGIVAGSFIWMLTISLLALFISAWVKVRPTAIMSLLAIFFIAGGFGVMANNLLGLVPAWGVLIDLNTTMRAVWRWLLTNQSSYGNTFIRGRVVDSGVPSWAGLVAMLILSGICLSLLVKKIRACEVVR